MNIVFLPTWCVTHCDPTYHMVFIWYYGHTDKAEATGSYMENQCIFLMMILQVLISPRPFFSSLTVPCHTPLPLTHMISWPFTIPFTLPSICSHWQYLPSNNTELNIALHIRCIRVMSKRLIYVLTWDPLPSSITAA